MAQRVLAPGRSQGQHDVRVRHRRGRRGAGPGAGRGHNSGGAIIAWTIIGGAAGFVVSPAQFSFQHGSYSNHGVAEPPGPAGHRVAPGAEYQFDID
jgi:hypothetical protein